MIKKCYIVGAGDNSGTIFHREANEYVIAADGGLEALRCLNITPDLIVGDFDSLGYVPEGENVIKHSVKKDETDMMLAVDKALELGVDEIEIFGGTGGRIDHTVANFQTMLYASKKGVDVCMKDYNNKYFVITDDEIKLPMKENGTFSVFAIGGDAENVNIKGAMYSLKNYHLDESNPIGVSNEYMGKEVFVSAGKGSLLIISPL